VAFDPERSELNWAAKDGALIGGFLNVVGIGEAKGAAMIERRHNGGLTAKDRAALAVAEVKFSELFPTQKRWRAMYDDPAAHGINGPIRQIAELPDNESCVFIGRVVSRQRRDENEAVLIKRRGGERREGQTLFADIHVVDDSIAKPLIVRFRPRMWREYGERIVERAEDDVDYFLFRGRKIPDFNMVIAQKARCLTKGDFFS
jgi:hypothetical protein